LIEKACEHLVGIKKFFGERPRRAAVGFIAASEVVNAGDCFLDSVEGKEAIAGG